MGLPRRKARQEMPYDSALPMPLPKGARIAEALKVGPQQVSRLDRVLYLDKILRSKKAMSGRDDEDDAHGLSSHQMAVAAVFAFGIALCVAGVVFAVVAAVVTWKAAALASVASLVFGGMLVYGALATDQGEEEGRERPL